MSNKTCSKCKEVKSYDEFYKASKEKLGITSACKCCCKKARKQSYENLKIRDSGKRYEARNAIRDKFREYKSKLSCINCGESHISCLEFHHRDPSTKLFTIGSMFHTMSYDKVMAEVAKCDVLCANCHRKLHNPI